MKKPPSWSNVYPQGTKEGEKERLFFICLSRDKSKIWKSVYTISQETNLSHEEVEKIISKYIKLFMVLQNPNDDNLWAYHENINFKIKEEKEITVKNQEDRIKKA